MGRRAASTSAAVSNEIDTLPQVYIIESLRLKDERSRKEGEVITRTLEMSGKQPRYEYIRTKQEFLHFLAAFERSAYRYLHLSFHGDEDGIDFTFGEMTIEELSDELAPRLRDRRLFLSACKTTTRRFAEQILLKQPSCYSVAGPHGKINFDDSAVLWSAFYHTMFRENHRSMSRRRICAKLQHVATLVRQKMVLFTLDQNEVRRDMITPSEV